MQEYANMYIVKLTLYDVNIDVLNYFVKFLR